MESEKYVANIIEFTGGISVHVNDDGIKPEKKNKNLQKFGYVLGETIGKGSYSKVKLCHSQKLNGNVAVKIVQKLRLPEEYIDKFLPREIAVLQKLEHPGLVHLIEVFETERTMYLVMEYISRGDLLDYINEVGSLQEADARRLFRQLVDVVSYLHKNHIYHRDIKLDNILIDKNYNIRLSDFGFARYNPKGEPLQTFCGSYAYAAPEILDGEYYDGCKIDIWSMGVCLYGMLNGKLPFRDTDADVLRESMEEKLKFYKHVSSDGKKLVRSILEKDPNKRYTTKDITLSNWMCRPINATDPKSMSSLAVSAVISDSCQPSTLSNTEHGFSCAQNTTEYKPSKVSGVLRAVAVNHSTGKSSINIRDVKLPMKKSSSVAMATGVSGPVGRKISAQLGIVHEIDPEIVKGLKNSDEELDPKNSPPKSKWAMGEAPKGSGKVQFQKAFKALTKFKCAVQVVKATKRFRRGPLSTILTIPQEEAMKKIIEKKNSSQQKEIKHLTYTDSAKVAAMCGESIHNANLLKRKSSQKLKEEEANKQEQLDKIEATFSKIIPCGNKSEDNSTIDKISTSL